MSDQINYSSYLKLGTGYQGNVPGLLFCIQQLSDQPEEHLFITIHHVFEIWFKQVIFDLNRVKRHLDAARNSGGVDGKYQEEIGCIPVLLTRSRDVFRNLLENFNIIETMGQLAFINFRDHLTGGSGFQSHQFRMIENMFGLKQVNRKNVDGCDSVNRKNVDGCNSGRDLDYKKNFHGEQLDQLEEALNNTIFDKIQAMLEDILAEYGQVKFVNELKEAVLRSKKGEMDEKFNIVLNKGEYNRVHLQRAMEARVSCLSYEAFLGALIVHQFQSKPKYQTAYSIITLIVDLDEALMSWRARHVNMVHRMIGVKVGTGGTSGYQYLSSTVCDRYKVFLDLFVMSTYILPSKFFD